MLLRGPSGCGKSDLALRAMACGWRLVADDRVRAWRSGGGLYGAAPSTLTGLIEVRGLDVVRQPALRLARIRLVVDAADPDAPGDRIPAPERVEVEHTALPRVRIALLEGSAVAKLQVALDAAAREAI